MTSPQEQVIFKVVVNKVIGLMITAFGNYSPKELLQILQSIFTWTEKAYWGIHVHTYMSYTYKTIPCRHGIFRSGQSSKRQVRCRCAHGHVISVARKAERGLKAVRPGAQWQQICSERSNINSYYLACLSGKISQVMSLVWASGEIQ